MLHSTALVLALSFSVHQLQGHQPDAISAETPAALEESNAPDELGLEEERPLEDAPLSEHRARLLELAFDAVSAMPTVPHAKNRARAQEAVMTACFELDQPQRARAYALRIDNWRRGTALAEYAFYCARHGAREEAQRHLALAAEIAADPEAAGEQAWRSDRIRAKIARTHWYLGQLEEGVASEIGLSGPELRELAEVRAGQLADSDLDAWMLRLEESLKALNFDQARGVLDVLAELFERYYVEVPLRDRIEAKLKSLWANLPVQIGLELMMELTETALLQGDSAKALQLLEEALYMMEGTRWRLEDRIPMQAKLAELRFRAGDERRARMELDSALAMYTSDPNAIVDIYRPDALRPVAEAYHAMGEAEAAREVFVRALEEGVHNPNARPRAVDLAETCCSMAVRGFEPDEELWERILELRGLLRAPW